MTSFQTQVGDGSTFSATFNFTSLIAPGKLAYKLKLKHMRAGLFEFHALLTHTSKSSVSFVKLLRL